MTAQDPALHRTDHIAPSYLLAASRLVRPLRWLGCAAIIAAAGCFLLPYLLKTPWLAGFRSLGLPGLVTGSFLLAALGLVACLIMTFARRRLVAPAAAAMSIAMIRRPAGWPSTAVTLLFAGSAALAVLTDWPLLQPLPDALSSSSGFAVAAGFLLLATPWLLAERYLAAIGTEQLPEVDDLRALVFLPVFFLAVEAVLQIAETLGFGTLYLVRIALDALLLCVCGEVAARVLATWFLPPRDAASARAVIGSTVAGVLSGRALSPAQVGSVVRSRFGMDFSRSWALRFMRAAAVPVLLLMVGFCWFLTGVTRIGLDERGSYERLGTPVAMLRPGLHLVLPWPFGVVRHVEYGVVHAVSVSYGDQGIAEDAEDHSTAEGDPPASANRLWDSEQPSDVSYIIASGEADRQSFQTVSASVRVLYRIGLTDAGARSALYRETDQAALVHALAGRLLAQFFAAHTLPSVLVESQGRIASLVQTQLQAGLNELGTGVDVVAVIIEAIHPPSGAASAYRSVQAAEIAANTEVASEQGRAQSTLSVAEMKARNAVDAAKGSAAETVSSAQVDLTDITADDRPYRTASQPFLLERYFEDLTNALRGVPLEIVDHRLGGASLPVIDLRPPGAPDDGLAAQRLGGK